MFYEDNKTYIPYSYELCPFSLGLYVSTVIPRPLPKIRSPHLISIIIPLYIYIHCPCDMSLFRYSIAPGIFAPQIRLPSFVIPFLLPLERTWTNRRKYFSRALEVKPVQGYARLRTYSFCPNTRFQTKCSTTSCWLIQR